MNTWLDLIIPIPFLIIGLVVYYRRKNMSDIEYQEEIKRLRNTPDDEVDFSKDSLNPADASSSIYFINH